MKRFTIVLILLLITSVSMGQNTVSSKETVGFVLDHTNPVPTINAKDLPPANLTGSPYLLEEFKDISFYYKGRVYNYPSNLDLISYTLDINYKGDTVFVSLQNIDSIHISYLNKKSTLFTESQIDIDNSEKNYIYIKLVSGKYNLYLRKLAILKEPDFDPKFAVGSKDYEILMREDLYIEKGNSFSELKNKPKRNKDFFGSDFEKAYHIIKNQELDYKEINDLVFLFNALNEQ